MKKMRLIPLLLVLLVGSVAILHAQEEELELNVDGLTDDSYAFYEKGVIVGTNGVAIRYGPTVLVANSVRVEENTGQAQAEGNVTIQREGYLWKGDRVTYN